MICPVGVIDSNLRFARNLSSLRSDVICLTAFGVINSHWWALVVIGGDWWALVVIDCNLL
jgi:hypothetical protein